MKTATAVILFYPEENIVENILSYSVFTEKVYIIDNTENPSAVLQLKLKSITNAVYFHDGINEGIALRLNQAARYAIADGFDWLLTMDQDSAFSEINITRYFDCINSFENKSNTAMFGIQYINEHDAKNICIAEEVNHLITSGSVLNLELFTKTNGFDEALFIDEVDLEYCIQATLNGYKIIRFPNIFLKHHLGKINYHRSLKNLAVTPRMLHSPIRLYYMLRNHLYLSEKYKNSFPEEIQISRKGIKNRIKNNLLYGKEKIRSMQYLLQAYTDFKKGKMGKK